MLRKRVQELRSVMALQEQGRKFFMVSCEEKLEQNRIIFPRLKEAVQEDVHIPDMVRKVSQERLQAEIYRNINICNMLQHQVRQRSQVRDQLQRQLQQLQDMERQENQAQMKVIHQLENNIEKVNMKIHAGKKVTAMYLVVRDVLKKELAHLPSHLDLLYEIVNIYEQQHKELEAVAFEAMKAADMAKEDMANTEKKFLEEREFQSRSLAAQKANVNTNRYWLKEAREKRAQARSNLSTDFTAGLNSEDSSYMGDSKEATQQDSAWVTETIKKAKTAVQCSCIWGIPSILLRQNKASLALQQHTKELKEKEQVLKEVLKEQELKYAEIKFRQPSDTNRKLEEEMRDYLQVEEARLEKMRAHMHKNKELLLQFENRIDGIFARLRGITIPGQDEAVETMGVEEKLQLCRQKLQFLVQLVADLPPVSHSPGEDKVQGHDKTSVRVRNWLEKTTSNDAHNLRISFKDIISNNHDTFNFIEKGHGQVPTRESIKKQGMQLIEKMKKSGKK